MVGNLHEEIGKKRSSKLYFKAQGKISAYRCIVKGFPCERVVDYMGIIICKLRIEQILGLIAYQDEFDSQYRFVPDGKLYSSTFQMSEILELDSHINSECLEADKSPSYDKYTEDIISFCEEERLAQQAPNVPVLNPIDQESEIKKEMPETVTDMILALYCRHGVED